MFPYPKNKDIIKNSLEIINEQFEGYTFVLEYNFRQDVMEWWERTEPEYGCLFKYYGKIKKIHYEPNDGEVEDIGEFECKYICCSDPVNNKSVNVYEAANSSCGDLEEALSALIKNHKFSDDLDYVGGILHIQRFYLNPNYRGKKLGYLIFPAMVDIVQKNFSFIITISPEPIHEMINIRNLNEEQEKQFRTSKEYKLAKTKKKMEQFLKEFEFKKIYKSNIWFLKVEL
jgi:hypothetical protein